MQFCCDALRELTERDYSHTTKATASSPLKLFVDHTNEHHIDETLDDVARQAAATSKWFKLTAAEKEPFIVIHNKQSSRTRSKTKSASDGAKRNHMNGFILFSSDARKTQHDTIEVLTKEMMEKDGHEGLTVLGATAKVMSNMWVVLGEDGQTVWRDKAKAVRENAKDSVVTPAAAPAPKKTRRKAPPKKRARKTKEPVPTDPDREITLTDDAVKKAVQWKRQPQRKPEEPVSVFETATSGFSSDEDD